MASESLNIRPGYSGTEVLGEIANDTDFLIGRVKVTITMKNSAGKVLDTDYTFVRGKTVEVNGFSTDSGIEPGGRAVFSETLSDAEFDSVATTVLYAQMIREITFALCEEAIIRKVQGTIFDGEEKALPGG